MASINFTVNSLMAQIEPNLINGLNNFNQAVLETAKSHTPEKSGDMIESYTKKDAEKVIGGYKASVKNDIEYSVIVDQGVKGKIYKYHKNGVKFYEGQGANIVLKTTAEMQEEISKYF